MATNRTIQARYRNISITTFIILVLSFGYYFFIYVKNSENQFNNKAFRIIENVGQNIENKYSNYSGIVENAIFHLIKYDYEKIKGANTEEIRGLLTDLSVPSELNVLEFNLKPDFLAQVEKDPKNQKFKKIIEKTSLNGEIFTLEIETSAYSITVDYKVDKLLQNTLRRDFFKQYMLFSDSQVFFTDLPVDRFNSVKLDSIFKREKGELSNLFHSTDRVELEFENKTQLLYVRPVNLSDTKTIYVGGIIEKQYYRQQAYSLETNTSIVLILLFVLLILSLPFVKIYLIDGNERLNARDVIAGFVVLVLGSAFVTLSLLGFYTQRGPSAKDKEKFLSENAEIIEGNVKKELTDILKQIDINELLLDSLRIDQNIKNQFKYDKTFSEKGTEKPIETYEYYQILMWIDKSGQQLVKWQDISTSRVKVTFRDYFSVPNNKENTLWLDTSINNSEAFYVDAIRSITEGKTYGVISKRSKLKSNLNFEENTFPGIKKSDSVKPSVVAMVTNMQSLDNLTLPSNLSYMVINADGLVLFHKNAVKILQENLGNELENLKLELALNSRIEANFLDLYDESEHRFYVRPIGKLPLFIVTYIAENPEKRIGAQIFSLSSLLYLLLFAVVIFQIILFLAFDHEFKRKTKGSNLFISWLWPKPSKNNIYLLLSVYIIISVVLFYLGGIYEHVLLTLSFFSFLVTVNLFVLRNFGSWTKFLDKTANYKMPVYFGLMVLLALWIFVKSDLNSLNSWTIVAYLIFVCINALVAYISFILPVSSEKTDERFAYNTWYFLIVVSLSVFAILGFYAKSYNFEKSIYAKHNQLSLAKNIYSKGVFLSTNPYNKFDDLNPTFQFGKLPENEIKKYQNESLLIDKIRFNILNEFQTSVFPNTNDQDKNGVVSWTEAVDSVGLTYSPGISAADKNNFTISSEKSSITASDYIIFSGKFKNFAKYILLSLLLVFIVIYYALNFWTQKVFLLGIIPRLRSNAKKLVDEMPFTYIISPPQSGVITYFEKHFSNVFLIDLRFVDLSQKFEPAVPKEAEIALIIDTNSIDLEVFDNKISIIYHLKKLCNSKEHQLRKIIIISIFSPKEVMGTFDDSNKKEMQFATNYLNIVGDFATAYFPLRYNEKEADNINLPVISQILNSNTVDSDCDDEDKILNVQARAQLYYYATWNSMEKREQLLIYDLATDGLMNFRNLYVIYHLMSRGILIYKDGTIELFNTSFANFVLTIVDKERSFDFAKDAKQTGSWSNMKLPLIMIIGGVLAFIFLTQQQLFNEIFGWFTAALALLPVLTKILSSFSIFSGGGKK